MAGLCFSNPIPGPSRHLYGEHPKALEKGVL